MRAVILLSGAALLTITSAASAEYYVVQSQTHRCSVTTAKAADQDYVKELGALAFNSRVEAEDRMKQANGCGGQSGEPGNSRTVPKKWTR